MSGRRLNLVEVNSPDKITVHRSLWSPGLVALGHLPTSFAYPLEKDEINQSDIGSHGIVSKSIKWK